MPAVFPYLGSYGNKLKGEYKALTRRYDDLTKRRYMRTTAKHQMLTLEFKLFHQTKRDAIQAFIDAREVDGAQFYVYNPVETQVVDLSGATLTGRHTCDEIVGDTLEWTQETNCRYTGSLTFFLIN